MSAKINIKQLKKQLKLADIDLILKAISIPIYSKTSTQWICYSGDKHKNPLDHKPKLYYYVETGVFMSYTASRSYDIIGLVQARLAILGQPCSFMDAVNLILSVTGIDPTAVTRVANTNRYNWEEMLSPYIRIRKGESTLPTYNPSILDQLETRYPLSWLEDGFSPETLEKYNIRYYERDCSTVIPVFDKDGGFVGARVREWSPERIEMFGRYHPLQLLDGTIYKFPSNAVWFGLGFNQYEIERTGTVMIGESEKFVLKLDSWYGEKNVAVGMFGSIMSTQKRNQLVKLGVNKVIYVPDCDYIGKGDEARAEWEKKVVAFGNQWKGYSAVEVVYDADMGLLGAKDNATDRDKEVWDKLYENRQTLI